MKFIFALVIVCVLLPPALGDWSFIWGRIKAFFSHPIKTIEKGFNYVEGKLGRTLGEMLHGVRKTVLYELKMLRTTIEVTEYLFTKKHLEAAKKELDNEYEYVSNEFSKAISKAKIYLQDALQQIRDFGVGLSKKFQTLYLQISAEFIGVYKKIEQIEDLLDPNEPNVTNTFDKIKLFVNRTEKLAQHGLQIVEDKLDATSRHAVELLFNKTSELQDWAESKLKPLLPKARKMGESIVKKYIDKNVHEMQACANKSIEPIHELFDYANETITRASTVVWDLVNSIEECSSSKQDIITRIITCITELVETGEQAYILIKNDIGKIELKLEKIGLHAIADLSCIGEIEIQMTVDRIRTEGNLQNLI